MWSARFGVLGAMWAAAGMALPAAGQKPDIGNGLTAVRPALQDGACVGFDIHALQGAVERPVAEIRWISGARWTSELPKSERLGDVERLTFGGFKAPDGGGIAFDSTTSVTVSLRDGDPFPVVSFRIAVADFDEAAWRGSWETLCPFYFLRCSLPGDASEEQLFYQGGQLYPGPFVDPYPISMGPMRGNWSENWSYAPAIWANPIPAMGLWSPDTRLFVAYEFQESRSTDQSEADIASAYCAGRPDHEGQFFCLVYPPAIAGWLGLQLPPEPPEVESRFRLLYNVSMPSDDDPNRWVIRELLARYLDVLPPAPRMNDMAWVRQGLEPSQLLFLHDIGESVQVPRENVAGLLFSPWETCEQTWFEPGATQLRGHQTGKSSRYAWVVGDTAGLEAQKRQIDYLITRAKREVLGGDECYVWEHPLDGTFRNDFGGARATTTRHMFSWAIASAMLHHYINRGAVEYLPYIDSMVRWTRHYLYDLAGMPDLPWAVFSMAAANGGEFLLDYYYTFRDDPERRELAEEAFRLAEMVVYRNVYYYTSDPDIRNALDPTFLLQAVNSQYWLGMVTWGELSRIPEMCIQMYLETGDPFFEYLTRGCLEKYYIGTANAAGEYAENVSTQAALGPEGPSKGWGANTFRWLAQPLGSAICQVDVGPKGAMAFCRGTRSVDIADYAFRPENGFAFTIVVDEQGLGAPRGPFDIMVTAPRRDLRGAVVRVNGAELPRGRFVVGTAGTDVLIRGLQDGDRVSIGEVSEGDAVPLQRLKLRGAFDPTPSADFECMDLTAVADAEVDNTWSGPWGGLVPGPHAANGVHYALIDPDANGRLAGVALSRRPVLTVGREGPIVLVWGLVERPSSPREAAVLGRATIRYADGSTEELAISTLDGLDFAYGRQWYGTDWVLYQVPVGRPRGAVERLELAGDGLLLAVTAARPGSARGRKAFEELVRRCEHRRRVASYHAYPVAPERSPVEAPWWDDALPYRVLLELDAGELPRTDAIVRVRQAFDAILAQVGAGAFAPTRVRVCEVDANGGNPREVLAQYEPSVEDGRRGQILLRLPGEWPGGKRLFYIYFGMGDEPIPAGVNVALENGALRMSSGAVSAVFTLSGAGPGPRMTALSFGDGPNILARAGWDEGFGHLCACQDGVTWYDFGALQDEDATAEVVSTGPLATTVRVTGLKVYGAGDAITISGVGTAGRVGASVKGEADWFLRTYSGDPRVDCWVEAVITDPATAWTRDLEARFGLADVSEARTVPGAHGLSPFATAGPLAIVGLDSDPARPNPIPRFTGEDGAVLSIPMFRGAGGGLHRSDVWRLMPSGSPDSYYAEQGAPVGIRQWAVERLEGGRILRPEPRPIRVGDNVPRLDWGRLLPYDRVAVFAAGNPDFVAGIASRDNPDEGVSRREEVAGQWAVVPGLRPGGAEQPFFYFDVEDTFLSGTTSARVVLAVEYLDTGYGQVGIEYDSADLSVTKAPTVPGAFKDAPTAIPVQNTGEWRTYLAVLPDARFRNGCNHADIRLTPRDGARFAVSRIGVAVVPR